MGRRGVVVRDRLIPAATTLAAGVPQHDDVTVVVLKLSELPQNEMLREGRFRGLRARSMNAQARTLSSFVAVFLLFTIELCKHAANENGCGRRSIHRYRN